MIMRLLTTAPDIVKLILEQFDGRPKEEKQAYLDAANEFGNTGLHWAALGGHLDTVKLLMDHGASPALANDKNYVPLDLASFNEKFDVVDYFLAKSEGLEGENSEEGFTMSAGTMSMKDGDKVEDSEAQAS
jgi:ankyrin repeat protein